MIYKISGKDNKTIKMVKSLKRKSGRQAAGRFAAEGRRIAEDAFEYAAESIYCTVVSEEFSISEAETVEKADRICGHVYVVPNSLFADISDTDTPQGILVVINMTERCRFELSDEMKNIAVLDGVAEPGNMGTIIRTAEALGFDGMYLMKGCADIYSPKSVRSTMGSIFRMNFKTDCTENDILELKNRGFSIIATAPCGETALESFETGGKQAVIIGNEAHGVSSTMLDLSDIRLRISMDGNAESLNAAVAAGIVMHWLKSFGKK